MSPQSKSDTALILQNVLASLTTSLVALTLGAAFGMLSGRGAWAGMISAAIFPIVACALGGTRVKVSGPTAPMSALAAVVVARVASDPALSDAFVTTVLWETALVLVVAGLLGTGRFIELVPRVVVSGFMTGIGVLVWLSQIETVIGDFANPNLVTLGVTVGSLALMVGITQVMPRVPGPLVAIILVPLVLTVLPVAAIPTVDLPETSSFDLFVPDLSPEALLAAFPYALQLAFLCYLDTLLTSLVIDTVTHEESKRDKELMAQGAATAAVALVGGIPGAQATIRSYMIVREGATQRWSGVLVGVFVLVELFLFRGAIGLIPQAVFGAVLLKVGFDVIDWRPFRMYIDQHLRGAEPAPVDPEPFGWDFREPLIGHLEIAVITATALITVLVDLNVAVFAFTILVFAFRVFHLVVDIEPLRLAGGDRLAVVTVLDTITVERLRGLHVRLEEHKHFPEVIVVDFRGCGSLDDTRGVALKATIAWMQEEGSTVLLARVGPALRPLLKDLGVLEDVGRLNVFRSLNRALMYAEHVLEEIELRRADTESCMQGVLVQLDVEASDQRDLFGLAAELAAVAGVVHDPDAFERGLLLAESSGSSGLDHGVAMPHAMTGVARSFALYLRLARPMNGFQTLDGSHVRHVFVVGGCDDRSLYLHLLARLAETAHHPAALHQLEEASGPDDVVACLVGSAA